MIKYFKDYQVYILILMGVICAALSIFSLLVTFQSIKKKKILIRIEAGTAIMLFANALTFIYTGDNTETGYWMARISNFLIYTMNCAVLFFFNEYITNLFMESGKFHVLPIRLQLGYILPIIGIILIIISQFTGMYYTFDSDNNYQRGDWHILCMVIPLIVIALLGTVIVQYNKLVDRTLKKSLLISIVILVAAIVLQLVYNGTVFIDIGIAQASISLYAFSLIDLNRVLTRAANTEFDTGLPNSRGYIYEAEKIIHYGDITRYCSFYFDIVNMMQINSKYGKEAGDIVIKNYAKYLTEHISKDEILGRLGGDFFIALILKDNTENFLKMLEDVPVEFDYNGKQQVIHVSAVAGGYNIVDKNIAAGLLIGKASAAVAYAKNIAMKPYVFIDDEMEAEIVKGKQLEDTLKNAIDNEEFIPYYQPKVDTKTTKLCGAEALVRWKNGDRIVPPIEFIPILEKSEEVCRLDFYMLEHVCQDLRRWLDEGLNPPMVSVNFSRKNLGNPVLSEDIYNVILKYGIPESLIQIEITETVDQYPMSYLQGVVETLRRYGISVAIDDFGTGSSSVFLLKEMAFDDLKIDRSFVNYKNEREKQVLSSIIQIAKIIGLDVIAEGVEDREQIESLIEMGCYRIQGFYFDRPLDREAFVVRIKNPKYDIR